MNKIQQLINMENYSKPTLKRCPSTSIFNVTYFKETENTMLSNNNLDISSQYCMNSSLLTNLYNWDNWHPLNPIDDKTPDKPKKKSKKKSKRVPSLFEKVDYELIMKNIKKKAYSSCTYTFLDHKHRQ